MSKGYCKVCNGLLSFCSIDGGFEENEICDKCYGIAKLAAQLFAMDFAQQCGGAMWWATS